MGSNSDSLPKALDSTVKPGKSWLDRLPVDLWEKRWFWTHRRLKVGVDTLKKDLCVHKSYRRSLCGCQFSLQSRYILKADLSCVLIQKQAVSQSLCPMGDVSMPTGDADRPPSSGPELLTGISCRQSFPVLAAILK